MKKVPTIFERDWTGDRSRVLNVPNPTCAWVFNGEGIPTRKWDGTAVLVAGGALYRRYDAKRGRTPPVDFIPADDADANTGHWPGWIPIRKENKEDVWFFTAPVPNVDGTYEFCGPKVPGRTQSNQEGLEWHRYIRHGEDALSDVPRDYDGLVEWLGRHAVEGIVWHHPDGRMAKIKRRDLGLVWPDGRSDRADDHQERKGDEHE